MKGRVRGWLEALALHRPELRAWALYDWANSAMVCTILTAIYPYYFSQVAGAGEAPVRMTERHSLATTIAMLIAAMLAPVLGALADFRPWKKRLFLAFGSVGVAATCAMFFIHTGDWPLAMVLFVLANVGAAGSFVFYDALLPHVAKRDELDRLSTSAYALGYLGGGLLLALNLAWILHPSLFGFPDPGPAGELDPAAPDPQDAARTLPSRAALLSAGLWWGVFSIPLVRRVREPRVGVATDERRLGPLVVHSFRRVFRTLAELRRFRHAFLLLVAYLLYNDGINTIIRMAAAYAAEREFDRDVVIGSILIVQFVGIPFAIAFGGLAKRIGAKRSIQIALVVYLAITLLAYGMQTETHFILLAFAVATVQGGSQALSRSLFASMIPAHRSSEFFGFFSVFEKFAGVLGPLLFFMVVRATDSSSLAILGIAVFFLAGFLVLCRVDVEEGRRAARAAEPESI